MDIIRTGINLSKTIKNVTRFKEILTVFARNGFDEFISKTRIGDKIPEFVLPRSKVERPELAFSGMESQDWSKTIGYRLRLTFEELGPSFVKLGQLLSTREDMFDEGFIEEMKFLQDKVKGLPFTKLKKEVEDSLGDKISNVFEKVENKPIGTASIGIVFEGQLKSGEEVVIKVRRPNIDKIIETDFEIFYFIVTQIEKVSSEIKYLGISKVIEDFSTTLKSELDFRTEALNAKRMKTYVEKLDKSEVFYIPKTYDKYSSEKVLVIEKLKGIPFNNTKDITPKIPILEKKLNEGVEVFIHNLLVDGFFHADLHGGNFFLLENEVIGIIDFGLMGSLGKTNRSGLIAILYSIVNHNYENLVYEFLDVAEYDEIPNTDMLIRDFKDSLSPFIGLTVQQTNVSVLFGNIVKTLSKHKIYLPREWYIVFRALMTLDGVGKSLGIDFDIFGIIEKNIKPLIQEMFSTQKLLEESVWSIRDISSAMRIVPRHIRWFLKEISKKQYALELHLNGQEKAVKDLSNSLKYIGNSFIIASLLISGVIMTAQSGFKSFSDINAITWILWGLSIILFFKNLIRI
jgi:ubiquinone biosynthesis protein